jgi:hypothetical protein
MSTQLNLGLITKSGQMQLSPGGTGLIDATLYLSDSLIQLKSVDIPVKNGNASNFSRMGFYDPSEHLNSVAEIICGNLSPNEINSLQNIVGMTYKDLELMDLISAKLNNSACRFLTVDGGPTEVPKLSSDLDGFGMSQQLTGDVIVCRHILEHLGYPEKLLRYLWKGMDEKGLLFIEVPDASKIYDGFLYPDFWDEHKSYFNKEALRNFLNKENFRILHLETMETEAEDVIVCVAVKNGSLTKNTIESSENQTLDELSRNVNSIRSRIQKALDRGLVFGFVGATHVNINFIDMFFDRKESCNIYDNHIEKIGKFVTKFSLPIQSLTSKPSNKIDIWATSLSRKRFEMYYSNFDQKTEIVEIDNL